MVRDMDHEKGHEGTSGSDRRARELSPETDHQKEALLGHGAIRSVPNLCLRRNPRTSQTDSDLP